MNNGQSSETNSQSKRAPAQSRTAPEQVGHFHRKRLLETEARAFWNRRALGLRQIDRKAA